MEGLAVRHDPLQAGLLVGPKASGFVREVAVPVDARAVAVWQEQVVQLDHGFVVVADFPFEYDLLAQ